MKEIYRTAVNVLLAEQAKLMAALVEFIKHCKKINTLALQVVIFSTTRVLNSSLEERVLENENKMYFISTTYL